MRTLDRPFTRIRLLLPLTGAAACAAPPPAASGREWPSPVPTAGPSCDPTSDGPFWIAEGETLTVSVRCGTGMTVGSAQLAVEAVPEGALWDPAAATLTWTPDLDDAAVHELSIRSAATGESAPLTIGVADAWDDPDNAPIVDPLRYGEEYGLPVLFLSPAPTTRHEYAPATVVHRGHVYAAEAKLRGSSSIDYPKNNFTLKFPREDPFHEPTRGFRDRRRVVLYGNFDDNSYLRTRLAFDVWNRIDPEHLQVQTVSAVLYIDGTYHGLYTLVDHVDRFLVERNGLDAGGDLFKAEHYTANFRLTYGGETKETLHDGYEKKEGLPPEGEPGAFADIEALTDFVARADDDTFRAQLGRRVDLRDYQDWWALAMLLFANDGVSQNAFHYHDAGPFRFAPWDFTASFGQNWRTVRRAPTEPSEFTAENGLFERMLGDPALRESTRQRYAWILHQRVSAGLVLQWLGSYASEIEPSAIRDERRWGPAYRAFPRWSHRDDVTTWAEEVAYLRGWIPARFEIQAATYGP